MGLLLSLLLFSVKVKPLLELIRNSDITSILMLVSELLHNRGVGFFSATAKVLAKFAPSSSSVSSAGRINKRKCHTAYYRVISWIMFKIPEEFCVFNDCSLLNLLQTSEPPWSFARVRNTNCVQDVDRDGTLELGVHFWNTRLLEINIGLFLIILPKNGNL